ncbi:MAG: hypothetical protein GY820_32230 [Gammaproteobacteria bacterium]|nr:hypothetical protein [Gammaproteobacteria bacterium]
MTDNDTEKFDRAPASVLYQFSSPGGICVPGDGKMTQQKIVRNCENVSCEAMQQDGITFAKMSYFLKNQYGVKVFIWRYSNDGNSTPMTIEIVK